MKKILYIQSRFGFGGINKITSIKENYLAERGYEIHNLTVLDENCIPIEGMYSDKIIFHSINKSKLDNLLKKPVIGRILRYIYFRFSFFSILLQVNPDIIVSTQPTLEPLSIIVLTFWKKRILEFHGWYNGKNIQDLNFRDKWNGLVKFRFYKIVSLTKKEAAHIKQLTKNHSFHIPNPLSLNIEKHTNCYKHKVISMSRFVEGKCFAEVLPFWKKIENKHPDWELCLYGNGPNEAILKDIIKNLNLTRVRILPYLLNVEEAYLNSSIFILPSAHEGFPLVLLESMAYGVPCVAYDCPYGPSEIIRSGKDGVLTNHRDPKDMVEKVLFLIENEDIRIKMGQQARENIKRFDLDRIMECWISLFNKIN